MKTLTLLSLPLAAALAVVLTVPSQAADGSWNRSHPARHEVNNRLNNQSKRVRQDVKDGQLNRRQARQLRREDKRIGREERAMARRDHDGGHLTKAQVQKLNRQENRVSRQINKESAGK